MFWSKNKKNVYPCKPQFYYIKVGCKGVFVTRTCFRDALYDHAYAIPYLDRLIQIVSFSTFQASLRFENGTVHYENTPMQYFAIFTALKTIIFR